MESDNHSLFGYTITPSSRSLFLYHPLSSGCLHLPFPPPAPPPPPPLNITALILPLRVQIFESAVKSLITPINLPDIAVQLKTFGQAH